MKPADIELLLIRQIFDDLQQQLSVTSTGARLLAVIHLDLCVELALSLVARSGGSPQQPSKRSPRQDVPRHELWTEADSSLTSLSGAGLPHARELRTLHEMRNLAQHAGTVPSTEAVQRAVTPVREFLHVVYSSLFGQDFNRFAPWHLVSCAPLRELFEDVDEALRRSMPTVAIAGSRQAHRRIIFALKRVAEGFVAVRHFGNYPEEPHDRTVRETTNVLASAMNDIRATLIIAGAGISVEDTLRFERSGADLSVDESVGGYLYVMIRRRDDPELLGEKAEFMFMYVVRLALALEQAYAGLFQDVAIQLRLRDQPLWKEISVSPIDR
jgi:hypothetical protein